MDKRVGIVGMGTTGFRATTPDVSYRELTYEAAKVLTRSVPIDDREARRLLGRPAIDDERSLRDLIAWMVEAGHLEARAAGNAAASAGSL